MKIKNNLFTTSNLSKLGCLLAFVFILGCGGGGSGGTASSPAASNSNTGIKTGAGSGETGSSEAFAAELQKISALTEAEIDLKNSPSLKLDLLQDPESKEISFKVKEDLLPTHYFFESHTDKGDLLISLNLVDAIFIENKTNFDIEINSRLEKQTKKEILSPTKVDLLKFSKPTSAQDYVNIMSSYIHLSGKVMDGTDDNITPITVKSGPIFQVKISENLASQSVKYHSNIDNYKLDGELLDISAEELKFYSNFRSIVYIINDTPDSHKITFALEGESSLRVLDSYGKKLHIMNVPNFAASHEFVLASNQGEFFSFSYKSYNLPSADETTATMKVESLSDTDKPEISLDILELFSKLHIRSI